MTSLGLCAALSAAAAPPKAIKTLHYAPNHNFSDNSFIPGKVGFNLADVNDIGQMNVLPPGVQGLIWIGQCAGVDAKFVATIEPYVGRENIFGFFLADDPDPRPNSLTNRAPCEANELREEADWIHAHFPGVKTFIVPMNLSAIARPSFHNAYRPENVHIDLYGIDPYPCRSELNGCDYRMIDKFVAAAEAAGIPRSRMVPVYQSFGGGNWSDGEGGKYVLPTGDQLRESLARWRTLVPEPAFDFAYSWGSQNGDVALEDAPGLQDIFSVHNSE